jgi:signal transduction histidine kinase
MITFPLQAVLFVLLLLLIGVGATAVLLDRYQMSQKLLPPVGTDPNRLADLFDTAPLGLLLLDKQTELLYANQVGQRLLPVLTETAVAGWREELMQDLAVVAATAVSPKFDSQPRQRLLTLAPDRRLSWWLCPLPQMTLLLLFDLSQTYQMQKASQRFLSTLSHELRTPLTAVLAHLDIVNQPETDPATRQSSLAIAQQKMKRLAHLPHVSERLYRARPDEPGSGLGLAITAEILRLHQTRLEIKSPPEGYESGVKVSFLLTSN